MTVERDPHSIPLAARMRPRCLTDFVGQAHLLNEGKPLHKSLTQGQLHSMILWGPPGSGKTTLAQLLAEKTHARLQTLSAVLAGVKDIRDAIHQANTVYDQQRQATILFVDEVHRFNKAQQDAFLPFVEQGVVTFIGATTENPAFSLNNALLSRARTYVLKSLQADDIVNVLQRALTDAVNGLGKYHYQIAIDDLYLLANFADGDARMALNLLEMAVDFAKVVDDQHVIEHASIVNLLGERIHRFDKGGDVFHEQISALHKAVRGSAPDPALYWLMRMLTSGCDPLYIARRIVRMASEDIGNADPRALQLALNAWDVQQRLGSPEGELALAQAVIYLACAAKSNAVYNAFNAATADLQQTGDLAVPIHLRNAPRQLMKELGYGHDYRYPHDELEAYVAGEHYFPEEMSERQYYYPVGRGLEIKIRDKLAMLKARDQQAHQAKAKETEDE